MVWFVRDVFYKALAITCAWNGLIFVLTASLPTVWKYLLRWVLSQKCLNPFFEEACPRVWYMFQWSARLTSVPAAGVHTNAGLAVLLIRTLGAQQAKWECVYFGMLPVSSKTLFLWDFGFDYFSPFNPPDSFHAKVRISQWNVNNLWMENRKVFF